MCRQGLGNQVSTFPDYPAEIRAPQGSLGGVSGFQVSVGRGVHTPGDACDVLVAMNAAALKQNIKFLKPGGVVIVDIDSFKESDLKKSTVYHRPSFRGELGIRDQIVEVPVTTMTKSGTRRQRSRQQKASSSAATFSLSVWCAGSSTARSMPLSDI